MSPADRTVVLQGIDSPRQVEVDASYLSRTNPYGDAPALEHAYAVTTYCAQGTTVDRAYVMADPSMDKQELYVATSRSRKETYLYETPEIQAQREEYATRSPYLREGLEHIAEAAQRDGSQTAARNEARRFEPSELSTPALVERRAAEHKAHLAWGLLQRLEQGIGRDHVHALSRVHQHHLGSAARGGVLRELNHRADGIHLDLLAELLRFATRFL